MKKRTITVFLCSILICGMIIHTFANSSKFADLNGDGEVTAADLTLLARYVAKVEPMPENNNIQLDVPYTKYSFRMCEDILVLDRVAFTFHLGYVSYELASYIKEKTSDLAKSITYNDEIYYYWGGQGDGMPYQIIGEQMVEIDWNEKFMIDGTNLHLISGSFDRCHIGDTFSLE